MARPFREFAVLAGLCAITLTVGCGSSSTSKATCDGACGDAKRDTSSGDTTSTVEVLAVSRDGATAPEVAFADTQTAKPDAPLSPDVSAVTAEAPTRTDAPPGTDVSPADLIPGEAAGPVDAPLVEAAVPVDAPLMEAAGPVDANTAHDATGPRDVVLDIPLFNPDAGLDLPAVLLDAPVDTPYGASGGAGGQSQDAGATGGGGLGGTSTAGTGGGGMTGTGGTSTAGAGAGGTSTPGTTSCYAWMRRLADTCPEHDTFLGYTACTTADGRLHTGEDRRWMIDATATRPPAAVSPPDPNATQADCSALPALQGDGGLPPAKPYYCETPSSGCSSLANSDMQKTLRDGSSTGAWTLMGGGTTGEGFMTVRVDNADMGNWTYIILSRIGAAFSDAGVQIGWPTTQVAVLYWNGFVRLKTWVASGQPDYRYGTSVVLGPFRPVDQDSTMVADPDLHSRIGTITFDSTSLAQGNPAAVATGGWYSGAAQGSPTKVVDATWNLSWLAPDASETRMHVEVDTNVVSDFVLPNGRLGVGSLSSMWASMQVHDSDTYSIGPLGSPALAGGAASALTVNEDTAPVSIGASDRLALTTTTSTTHNSGSPDLSLKITVTSWSN